VENGHDPEYKDNFESEISNNTYNSLPPDFKFGYASAAPQVESSVNTDGKSDSIWDAFARLPGKIIDRSTPNDTIREYELFNETVLLLKLTGSNTYRFSYINKLIKYCMDKIDP
jgi:beta-glucosidase/6-phospho-beta-glucosidase/beta-galactosidase